MGFLRLAAVLLAPVLAYGAPDSTEDLKKLSVEELMDIEVTSVSRQPEKLTEAASAVQVVASEDIRRAGANSIPEALRLAPNLQVAQVNGSQWAISARGFNNVLANKLLVLIDGRTVYTPFYAGVFWDAQDVLLEDVDRIEVVSGPGGTLWGANAVNGVINIITKSAQQTQGGFAEAAGGDELGSLAALRYGGRTKSGLAYRVYGKTIDHDETLLHANRAGADDDWRTSQVGLRLDWDAGETDSWTFQADVHKGQPNPDGAVAVDVDGGNALGRWQRKLSATSDLQLQVYYDRSSRDFNNGFSEVLGTWDFDGQHRFHAGERHEIIWGLGARVMGHDVENLPLFGFTPANSTLHLYSAFIQDEIALIADTLRLTLGTKFERNDYTGGEWQPSARLAWMPSPNATLWAALSRAVRTPSRLDRDFTVFLAPGFPLLTGSPDFESEEVLASELGWRWQAADRLSLSVATFYNDYDKIRSAEPGLGPFGTPITLGNGVQGNTYGVELAAMHRMKEWWRLRGGYTWLTKHLEIAPGSVDLNGATAESDDPEQQLLIQSFMDLPRGLALDVTARYVDELPAPRVPSYIAVDMRLAWRPTTHVEIALVGQNLLDERHLEFARDLQPPRDLEIERSVFGRITCRF